MEDGFSAPYRIETERLVLRCYEPQDARVLVDVVSRNMNHLLPWMPWASYEPQTLDDKIALVRTFRGRFDLDQDFIYAVFDRDGELLGGTGLHPRTAPGSLEIGYWVDSDRTGAGLATEMARALTRIALEVLGALRVEIRCQPDNEASKAIPKKLGYLKEGLLRAQLPWPGEAHRDAEVFAMLASELPDTPCATASFVAYDVLGRELARF